MSASQRINGILRKIPSWPIYLLGPIPGFWVFWLAVQDRLGADPLQVLEHELGERGLQFLVLTLLVTPVRRISGVSLLKFRRAIGLVAFFYIMAHLLTWFVLDRQLDLPDIWREIVKRPFITIGMAGFLAMVPLAITSNNRSIRKMGAADVVQASSPGLCRGVCRGRALSATCEILAAGTDYLRSCCRRASGDSGMVGGAKANR